MNVNEGVPLFQASARLIRVSQGLRQRRFRGARSIVRVSVRFKEDISIVNLSGKFVAGGDGPYLRQKVKDLIEAGVRKLLFEFEDVPYIDSTGLGFLAGSRELAAEAGAIIVLSGMNPHVRRILDGVKLTQFFELVDDENAGLARLNQIQTEKLSDAPRGSETALEPPGGSAKPGRARKRPAAAAE